MLTITGVAVAAAILEHWVIAITWPICFGGIVIAGLGITYMWGEYKGET